MGKGRDKTGGKGMVCRQIGGLPVNLRVRIHELRRNPLRSFIISAIKATAEHHECLGAHHPRYFADFIDNHVQILNPRGFDA